jgi:hypothetical protein
MERANEGSMFQKKEDDSIDYDQPMDAAEWTD